MDRLMNRLEEQCLLDRYGKTASYLLDITAVESEDRGTLGGEAPYTHSSVAKSLGLNRTTVTEVLKYFEQMKWIRCGYGKIQIVNREGLEKFVKEQMQKFMQEMEGVNLKEYPGIKPYRDTFLKLGMNPNKFMCSVEALAKRVQKGKLLPNINPIVDLGNALSLKYSLPMGKEEVEPMPVGELVYVSKHTVKTRRWIWRQSDDGKIDEDTNYIFYPIDGFLDTNKEKVDAALEELALILKEELKCEVKTGYIDSNHRKVNFFE